MRRRWTFRECAIAAAAGLLLFLAGSLLFSGFRYWDIRQGGLVLPRANGLLALLCAVPCFRAPVMVGAWQKKRHMNRLRQDFQDYLQALSVHLSAGKALEPAMTAAGDDIPETAALFAAVSAMRQEVTLGTLAESALSRMATDTGLTEAARLAEVMQLARRFGGNMADVVRTAGQSLADRMEARREMETLLSGKKTELNVMSVMPVGLLALLALSAPDYMRPVWETLPGKGAALLALALILAGLWSSARLAERLEAAMEETPEVR